MNPADQLDLFTEPQTNDPPICVLCGRTRRWNNSRREWGRYCGGKSCDAETRPCRVCGKQFSLNDPGAGTRYCSTKCKLIGYNPSEEKPGIPCLWCGTTRSRRNTSQGAYICRNCTHPLRYVIHNLRKHHVPITRWRTLVADPTCPICGAELLTRTQDPITGRFASLLVIDHDHDCCPGPASCGNCVRGLICTGCNKALGMARDDPLILRQMAQYLEQWNEQRHTERDATDPHI